MDLIFGSVDWGGGDPPAANDSMNEDLEQLRDRLAIIFGAAPRRMWRHYCPRERTLMDIAAGEPCNWCGAQEPRR